MSLAAGTIPKLDLGRLPAAMEKLLPELAVAMAYAAAVCLEEEGHNPGALLGVWQADGDSSSARQFTLDWSRPTDEARRSWANPEEATEHGACAVAALLVEALTGLVILNRARRGTGFDYWLGRRDENPPLFQGLTRLEISGIRRGDNTVLRARERQKLAQIERGETPQTRGLSGIVVIVEFGAPKSRLTQR
jgi:hypothetical protein